MTQIPGGFSLRRPAPDDLANIVNLMNTCSQAEIGLRNFALDSLQRQSNDVDGTSLTGAERLYLKAGMSIILRSLVYQKVLKERKP